MPAPPARARCSARNTATRCAWWRWARASGNTLGWSVELCGGTHVRRTGDIGLIAACRDSGVAAGVRRLEALDRPAARKAAEKQVEIAKAAAAELKVPLEDMPARVAALLEERKKLERELSDARKKLAMGGGGAAKAADDVRQVNGVKLIARAVSGIELKDLRSLADEGKKQLGSGVVAIVGHSATTARPASLSASPTDLVDALQRGRTGAKGAEALGGKGGGGRPDMAQAGGPDGSKADAALKAVEQALGG